LPSKITPGRPNGVGSTFFAGSKLSSTRAFFLSVATYWVVAD
jgi:hypothetical protein